MIRTQNNDINTLESTKRGVKRKYEEFISKKKDNDESGDESEDESEDDDSGDDNSEEDTSKNEPPNKKRKNDVVHPHLIFLLNNLVSAKKNTPQAPTTPPPTPAPKTLIETCKNPLCNHKSLAQDPTPPIILKKSSIKDIDDLIELGKTYHCKKNKEFNGINLRLLCNLVGPLVELKNLIGMKKVKEDIVDQILYFVQGFHKNNKCGNCIDCTYNLPCAKNTESMLHTVITGPPGVGKTELGKILGKIYKEMGVLSKGHFTLVTRSDLVAEYLGQTAIKTQKKITSCLGGVMFIDEAYSLGNPENRDSFSKECIDTLNQNMTEKRDFLCIIAGYKDALEKCFFSVNDGLRRRFPFRYDIEPYSAKELMEIFLLKVKNCSWETEFNEKQTDTDEIIKQKNVFRKKVQDFFESNHTNFPYYGGDVETLLDKCKIIHNRRVVFAPNDRKMLSVKDIEMGFKSYMNHRKYDDDPMRNFPKHLFI